METGAVMRETTEFIDSFPLRVLHLTVNRWNRDAVLSSKTLMHVELEIENLGWGCSGNLGALPNLLHLSFAGSHSHYDFHFLRQWPDFPSLLSLRVAICGPPRTARANIMGLLHKSPRIVTLQIPDTDALSVTDFFRAHWNSALLNNVGDPLRLIRIIACTPSPVNHFSSLAAALHQIPGLRIEWHTPHASILKHLSSIATEVDTIHLSPGELPPLTGYRRYLMFDKTWQLRD